VEWLKERSGEASGVAPSDRAETTVPWNGSSAMRIDSLPPIEWLAKSYEASDATIKNNDGASQLFHQRSFNDAYPAPDSTGHKENIAFPC